MARLAILAQLGERKTEGRRSLFFPPFSGLNFEADAGTASLVFIARVARITCNVGIACIIILTYIVCIARLFSLVVRLAAWLVPAIIAASLSSRL